MTRHLVVISGLPGVGKTRAAEIAAASTVSMHLSIDATATRTADEVADALTARLGARRGPSR